MISDQFQQPRLTLRATTKSRDTDGHEWTAMELAERADTNFKLAIMMLHP